MNATVLQRLLTAVPLFQDFTAEELRLFLARCQQQHLPAGREVVEQDKEGSELYAVMSGLLLVQRCASGPNEKPVELARLRPGDIFGELSLVDAGPRSASVITLESSRLIFFDRAQMVDLPIELQATLYRNIAMQLAKRLRLNNDQLSLLFAREQEARAKAQAATPAPPPTDPGFIPPKQRAVRRGGP